MALRAINVRAKGQMTLPADIRKEMGLEDGGVIYLQKRGDETILLSADQIVDPTAGVFRKYAVGKPVLEPDEVRSIAAGAIASDGSDALQHEDSGNPT